MTHGLLTPPGHVTKCHDVDCNLGAKEVTFLVQRECKQTLAIERQVTLVNILGVMSNFQTSSGLEHTCTGRGGRLGIQRRCCQGHGW
jgi:hypothetical protein